MALYCIHALDRPDRDAVRQEHYAAHRAFLETAPEHGVAIQASGPLVSEDGGSMIGSLFIVEAASESTVRAFNAADPFAKAELWVAVSIHRFHMRRGAFAAPPLS